MNVTVIFDYPNFGLPSSTPPVVVNGVLANNQIQIPINQVQPSSIFPYLISVSCFNFNPFISITSNVISQIINSVGCYIPQVINVTGYTFLPNGDMQINITTNIPFPFQVSLSGSRISPSFDLFFPITVTANSNQIIVSDVPAGPWTYTLQSGTITSNQF